MLKKFMLAAAIALMLGACASNPLSPSCLLDDDDGVVQMDCNGVTSYGTN